MTDLSDESAVTNYEIVESMQNSTGGGKAGTDWIFQYSSAFSSTQYTILTLE